MCNSPLQVQGRRAQSVGEDFSLRIEVGERSTFLHVRHHGRVPHPETAVDPTTTTSIGQHSEESVLVNVVLALIQAFSRGLVSRTETVVGFRTQPNKPVSTPLDLEQTGRPLVVRLARDATCLDSCPRESGETSLDVFFLVIIAALGRKPFGTVPEVMLAMFWCNEIVDGITGQRDIGGVRVHLAVLVEWPLDVSTIKTAHSVSTNERSSDILCLINSVICAKYINIENQLTCLRSRSRIPAYGAWRTDRRRSRCGGAGRRSRAPCST